jgi:hypothetical protein
MINAEKKNLVILLVVRESATGKVIRPKRLVVFVEKRDGKVI